MSDDPTAKDNGGDYGFAFNKSNPNLPPTVVNALFNMKVNQISDIILASPVLANQGPSLQIVKLTAVSGDSVTALHIVFNLKDDTPQINQLKFAKPTHQYVTF
jgi:hypothetical protein